MSVRPPLKRLLVSPIDASSVARIRAGVATRDGRSRRGGLVLAGTLAALAAVAVAGVLVASRREIGPLTSGGRALGPVEGATTLSLDDGSSIALREGARIVPRTNDGRELVLDLERGTIELEVMPGTGRSWLIEAGLATVAVVGTQFVVARDDRGVDISVQRGEVVVRGERVVGRVRPLVAGQSLRVEDVTPATVDGLAARDRGLATAAESVIEVVAARPEHATPRPRVPRGSRGVEVQDAPSSPDRALAVAEPSELAPDERTVAELLQQADAARAAGDPRAAADLLERLVDEHAGDPRVAVAAFTLARLQLDVLGESASAIEMLERARALGLPATMEEDARARTIEALSREGRAADARAAAAQFERDLPHSARLPEVRRWARLDER